MNRAARLHLLGRLDVAARPLCVVRVAPTPPPSARLALLRAVESMGFGSSLVLPSDTSIEFVKPHNAPRVVAGKGGRRRGVRGRLPPLRIVTYPAAA